MVLKAVLKKIKIDDSLYFQRAQTKLSIVFISEIYAKLPLPVEES